MRWDPFRALGPSWGTAPEMAFVPRFEVRETRNHYVLQADLPGVKEADLEISATGNRLTISGRREVERHEDGEVYHSSERLYGDFLRSFTLPAGADTNHAKADLKDGVLTIHVPKRKEAQPRRISIGGLVDKVKHALRS